MCSVIADFRGILEYDSLTWQTVSRYNEVGGKFNWLGGWGREEAFPSVEKYFAPSWFAPLASFGEGKLPSEKGLKYRDTPHLAPLLSNCFLCSVPSLE